MSFRYEVRLSGEGGQGLVLAGKVLAEAEAMVAAVEKAGVANMVSFNYRRVPAIALFKQVIDEGRIGRPFHYRAQQARHRKQVRGFARSKIRVRQCQTLSPPLKPKLVSLLACIPVFQLEYTHSHD